MQRRVFLFIGAIVSALTVLVWTGWTAWRAADQLGNRISRQEVSSFQLGDTFSADLHELRSLFRRYEATRDPTAWTAFAESRGRLHQWLGEQRNSIHRPGEIQILEELSLTFETYWEESLRLRNVILKGATREEVGPRIAVLGDLAADMAQDTRRLLRLREEALQSTIADARTRLSRLVKLLFGTFVTTLVLAAILAFLVYRDLIRPLRIQLVETRGMMERQEKLASLGVLAAGVAHEIRNPLTAIKARLFTQQKRLPAQSPAAEDAAIIHSEINRLERIVRGFLEFARPAEPSPTNLPLRQLLSEVVQILGPGAENDGVTLLIDPGTEVRVRADPAQLKQVLINLVRNGIDASGPGGQIRLQAEVVDRRLAGIQGPVALIEVSDNGQGIAPEAQGRLFDPFFTTKADGTGLGLAIAARIIEKHGGLLEYQTRPSTGTTFAIILPLSP